MTTWIACRDCAAIQQMPPKPPRGRLECWQCARVLEYRTGRSLDGALACALATFLLLFPANLLPLMTVHVVGVTRATRLGSGVFTAWAQGWPLLASVIGLLAIVLPFLRFGLLSATLLAIRLGARGPIPGTAFRWCEMLDMWAMADVLLIGAGIGYGRIVSQIPVFIDAGGWCFVTAAVMTMITRATLERRAVWERLEPPPRHPPPDAIGCTSCDLVLPREAEGERCPRCTARVHRRESPTPCAALTLTTWALMPLAYGVPMSEYWKLSSPSPHTIINGIELLFEHGFWPFGVIIFCVSVIVPFTKVVGLSWFLISVHRGSTKWLRRKTKLFRAIDEAGRWSCLDPFSVMIFAPLIQFGPFAHIDVLGGSPAFLSTVVLSMIAARMFDPRLMWDAQAAPQENAVAEAAE